MSYIPVKMPNGADTFSNFAAYKKVVNLAPAVVPSYTTLLTTEDQLGSFMVTEVILHLDNVVGTNYLTFTSSIGFNGGALAYNNVCASVTKGSTSTSSTANSLWLRTNKFERYEVLGMSGSSLAYSASYPNYQEDLVLKITNSILGAGSTGTIIVAGIYTGARP